MVHIIGSTGYIGINLCNYLSKKKVRFLTYSNSLNSKSTFLDLRNEQFSNLILQSNDIVVLLAAVSSPDLCTNQYYEAYKINVTGTKSLINYCFSKNVRVIFLSSDAVNGPTSLSIPNDERSLPNPFGNYAKMKYEIETQYKKNFELFKVLRLSYVVSSNDKFSSYLNKCCLQNSRAEVYDGLYRSAVMLNTVLESIYSLIVNFNFNDYYLCNVSGNQLLSRKDLAIYYKKAINQHLCFKIVPTPESILQSRPNIIYTKSLYLSKLLKHNLSNIL